MALASGRRDLRIKSQQGLSVRGTLRVYIVAIYIYDNQTVVMEDAGM